MSNHVFTPAVPPPLPALKDCIFYHSMDFKDGSSVTGPWDIRGYFDTYIGNYPIAGKTLLDVGTASGYLAFSAEKAGAKVTALEGSHASEYHQLHFETSDYHLHRVQADAQKDRWFNTLKNGFWYGWYKNDSNVEMIYTPLISLDYWDRSFDVVLAGAILEHLSDPVSVIWSLCRLAKEALIIAFTPVIEDESLLMTPANTWNDPNNDFTWWNLSRGLYRRVFANVGFEMQLTYASAMHDGKPHSRPTIVATRQTELSACAIRPMPGDPVSSIERLQRENADLRQRVANLENEHDAALRRLTAIEASASWRMTAPLRTVIDGVRRAKANGTQPTART